jgi:hypothetical protein
MFRISTALFGFTPAYTTLSVQRYVLVFSSPMILMFDCQKSSKFVRAPPRQVALHLAKFVGFLVVTGLCLSAFFVSTLTPSLADPSTKPDDFYSWRRLWNVIQWKDTMLYLVLFQLTLSTFGEGLMFATTLITGIRAQKLMDNPVFESTSPSDFWGRRWNLLVHTELKNGIYKPVRFLGGSHQTAVACTFAASGLFHEHLLPTAFFDYPNVHGPTMVFFLWQVVLVAGESTIGHWTVFSLISKAVPRWGRTLLVLLLGLPVGHLFCDSYIFSDFFRQETVFLVSILPLDRWS